ncbi:putative ion channel POLLUX-like 2 [Selaginella moellendorffii]|uniref:putative ion channel POLLUX-like 2 n=1 Tax=Selaginella moellendorffii TaxID=88036 RepID=UPI000D1C6CDB|nr:putative ion channel POLLUX-like 2 [Selaginella moellendorffii]|eukprot:XP_024542565.1 putative ion channel POLLUX-like 2 [Selaginella moellendorffii]
MMLQLPGIASNPLWLSPSPHRQCSRPVRARRKWSIYASNKGSKGDGELFQMLQRFMRKKARALKGDLTTLRTANHHRRPLTRTVTLGLIAVSATLYLWNLKASVANILKRVCVEALSRSSLNRFASISLSALSNHRREFVANLRWSIAHLSYLLDVVLERHPTSYLVILGTTCAVLIFIGGFAFYHLRTRKQTLGDAFWEAWACLCNSSTHLKEQTVVERATGLLLAIGGLMFYSLLTSTLTAQFKSRMEILREGALFEVMEVGHTVVCGTNNHLSTLLKQLNKAQDLALKNKTATSRKKTVVLLSEKMKKSNSVVSNTIKECKALNVLVRSGKLNKTSTFQTVGASRASRIIFLARKTDSYEADADVVLSVLALQPLREEKSVQVIAEVSKEGTAQLLQSLAGQNITTVQDLSSKLLVQCSRQNGLIDVYHELLDHGRQVIILRHYPSLAGYKYRDVRRSFQEGIVCGIIRDGAINFHPKDGLALESTDRLIIISHKNSSEEVSILPATAPAFNMASVARRSLKPLSKIEWSIPKKEYILILGWRPSMKDIVAEYDDYVGPGSELLILAQEPLKKRQLVTSPLKNIRVTQKIGNPLNETDLASAISEVEACKSSTDALSIVVIIDDKWQQESISKSDKQSIYALLLAESVCIHLSQVASLVAELVDTKLGKQVVKSHDTLTFIGTSELIGLVTAQVAENTELNDIWTELLNPWGNEIYVKDIALYMKSGEAPTFQELADRAVFRDEVAIGYRMHNNTVINPASKDVPLCFSRGDSLVVICEFEYGNYQGN